MLGTMTDMELVAEIRAGNMAAFRTFYYRHADRIFGVTTRILGPNRADREDVVQEVFFQVYRSIGGFKGISSVSTWLFRIAANVSYSVLRRPLPSTVPISDETTHSLESGMGGCQDARVDARRTVKRMYEMLERLSPKNRMVFTLYEFEGLTLERIASVLEIPLYTAAARLRRSREQLMTELTAVSARAKEEGP